MSVVVVTPPAPEAWLDLELVKAHLREEDDNNDDLIDAYITAACGHIDGPAGILNRAIWPQTLELRQNVFCGPIRLPYGPVTSVLSVKYVDQSGVEQTMDSSGYVLVGNSLTLGYGASWPTHRGDAEGVRIRYEAGYDTLPTSIHQALLLLIGHWYANRETVVLGSTAIELPMATEALLQPFRNWTI